MAQLIAEHRKVLLLFAEQFVGLGQVRGEMSGVAEVEFAEHAQRLQAQRADTARREVDRQVVGILQVVAVTNPLGLGYEQALVGVKTSGSPERAADEIARWAEADYVVATAGQFDLVVELVAANRRHLLDLTSRLRALPDVVSTETFVYLEMWKQLYDWGSGMPKEDTGR